MLLLDGKDAPLLEVQVKGPAPLAVNVWDCPGQTAEREGVMVTLAIFVIETVATA